MRWNPDQEFIGQGAANISAGLFGGFPIGGSFSRSSLNYLSGARTRWSGAVTGAVVLVFLTFWFTIILSPHVEQAVVLGILAAVAVHIWRELEPGVEVWADGHIARQAQRRPLVWLGGLPRGGRRGRLAISPEAERLVLHLDGLGQIDLTRAQVLKELMEQLREGGLDVEMEGIPPHAVRILEAVMSHFSI